MSTGNLLTGVAPWLGMAFAAQVVRGIATPLVDSFATTYIQRHVPPQLLGRALANVYGGVSVAAAVGYLAAGPILDATSPRWAMSIVGVGGLAGTGLAGALMRRQRA